MRTRRLAAALAATALVLTACDGGAEDGAPVAADPDGTDGSGDEQAAGDDGADPDGGSSDGDGSEDGTGDGSEDGTGDGSGDDALPVSTFTLEPIDAPRSVVDIRVAEIIIEFDGEVTDEGTLLTLEEPILFDFDSDRLKPEAREALDDIAEVLAYYPDAPVQVLGHTDDQGSADYNLGLSQRRADAVAQALTERGIPTDRLTAEGRGLTEPVASNDDEEGRAQNRRVEVLIEGVEPPATD
jgi:outer membrane protein OmpA-like peptidoglycan-associated protein